MWLFIDRDPRFFAEILNYLRDPEQYVFTIDEKHSEQFELELDYFGLSVVFTEDEEEEPEPEPQRVSNPKPLSPQAIQTITCVEKNTGKPFSEAVNLQELWLDNPVGLLRHFHSGHT